MDPSRAHGPSPGPAEANGLNSLLEAHGPPKVHEPRGLCTPLSVALIVTTSWLLLAIVKPRTLIPWQYWRYITYVTLIISRKDGVLMALY